MTGDNLKTFQKLQSRIEVLTQERDEAEEANKELAAERDELLLEVCALLACKAVGPDEVYSPPETINGKDK